MWRAMARILLILAISGGLTHVLGSYSGGILQVRGAEAATGATSQTYDVVVIGGTPGGIAAALAAARSGARTLLVEPGDTLGGVLVRAGLNMLDMSRAKDGKSLITGLFQEFHQLLGGDVFDVAWAREAFATLLARERNIHVLLGAGSPIPVLREGDSFISAALLRSTPGGVQLSGKVFIDATEDGDFAAASGVPYTVGREDTGRDSLMMAATLLFQVGGVNWDKVVSYLSQQALETNLAEGANRTSAWGYGAIMRRYQPLEPETRMRGLNLGRQSDGTVMVNGLLLYGVDGTDPVSVWDGLERGGREIPRVVDYLKRNAPGFENAYLIGAASHLYVRETRHLAGMYRLTLDDVLENRDFWDRIAIGSYPVDVQSVSLSEPGYYPGKPVQYSIPFRALVPRVITNLMFIGRAASYGSLAAGSARVIPVEVAEGEAAGIAAAYSVFSGISIHDIARSKNHISTVQRLLSARGASLEPFRIPPEPYTRHWAYGAVKVLRARGLVAGGIQNDFRYDDNLTRARFVDHLNNILTIVERGLEQALGRPLPRRMRVSQAGDAKSSSITLEEAAALLRLADKELSTNGGAPQTAPKGAPGAASHQEELPSGTTGGLTPPAAQARAGVSSGQPMPAHDDWEAAREAGLIPDELVYTISSELLTNGQAYVILASFLKRGLERFGGGSSGEHAPGAHSSSGTNP